MVPRMNDSRCPLTGLAGKPGRRFSPETLVRLHEQYMGAPLPPGLQAKYFTRPVQEYDCAESGLRWYSPGATADGDYYEFLGRTFPWYYDPNRWDKNALRSVLRDHRPRRLVDIGCGAGELLLEARALGVEVAGVEINPDSLHAAKAQGLDVRSPDELPERWPEPVDILTMLQVIEHVEDPLAFVHGTVKRFRPRRLVISAPCHRSLLGLSSDPLSWPPHHSSAWSEKALRTLAAKIGYEVESTRLEDADLSRLLWFNDKEPDGSLPGPAGFIARCARRRWGGNKLARFLLDRAKRVPGSWATCSHSIFCVLRPISND